MPVKNFENQSTISEVMDNIIVDCFFLTHSLVYQPVDGQTSCKVWWTFVERRRCSNEAKTRTPLKFAGVPQTHQPVSAVSGLKFTILWGHVEEILLFNTFFRLSISALVAKIQVDKVVRWCPDGKFLAIFCVLYSSELHAAHFRHAF